MSQYKEGLRQLEIVSEMYSRWKEITQTNNSSDLIKRLEIINELSSRHLAEIARNYNLPKDSYSLN